MYGKNMTMMNVLRNNNVRYENVDKIYEGNECEYGGMKKVGHVLFECKRCNLLKVECKGRLEEKGLEIRMRGFLRTDVLDLLIERGLHMKDLK